MKEVDVYDTGEMLELLYIPLSQAILWDRNPKAHDVGGITASIQRHGFKDPSKFEPALNDGKGGLVEGNGRVHTLRMMKVQGMERPRGILENDDGEWLVPVLFGVDAESQAMAEAYAIDHNNLTMLGGDFTGWDLTRMYDEGQYATVLSGLAQLEVLPVTVDEDEINRLLANIRMDWDEIDSQLDWSEEDEDGVGDIPFTFGELSASLPLDLYAKFAGAVMETGDIAEVLGRCVSTDT